MAYKSKFEKIEEQLWEMACQGLLHVMPDGMFRAVPTKFVLAWYHVKLFHEDCLYWHTVMSLPCFGKGQSFVPIRCLNCWKVVVRPRDYDEMMRLLDIMKRLDRMSKAGTEQRNLVPALWGAYFYNDTKEEGLNCYQQVYSEVKDAIFPDVPDLLIDKYIILKRGCTEYEHGINGPSDKWQMFDGQVKFEEYIKSRVEVFKINDGQSDFLKSMVLENWKAWAHSRGDLSYVPYNEGKRLTPEYVTYQNKK
ncbi:hypothetical protein ACFLXA_02895 [Chloroflexota bacterium]